jgi:hypothetical protein
MNSKQFSTSRRLLSVAFCLVICPVLVSGQDWVSLFDGKTLNGWKPVNGTAKYEVVDGAIKGWTSIGSPNSFLCTERNYGDFELEFEVKADSRLNSGVQFRSESKADFKNGRVHGYQVEIAANGNAGLIYDEARRGKWLNPVSQVNDLEARKALKENEWNRYRVVCKGNSIKAWLNGVLVSDIEDSMTSSGFIGLQVHSFKGEPPAWVMWRNIRIREL